MTYVLFPHKVKRIQWSGFLKNESLLCDYIMYFHEFTSVFRSKTVMDGAE